MGCASSKTVDVDVYRPPPSSFAVFDVAGIQEPWVNSTDDAYGVEKPVVVAAATPVLEKLRSVDDATRPWNEVSSEVLEYLAAESNPVKAPAPVVEKKEKEKEKEREKKGGSNSIRTLEELESKISSKKEVEKAPVQNQIALLREVPKSLKDNIFIVRDRLEREKEGKFSTLVKTNILSDFKEICPPGGANAVVLYTTSLGGVRRTHEDCNRVRQLLEYHQVVVDERDVALDGGFLSEIKELLGDDTAVPRLFVKGRYIGGAEEVVGLNETGRLSRIFNWVAVERGIGRLACGGCGGARFVLCFNCGGSCKVVGAGGVKERCGECNENGLLRCPLCNESQTHN